jgi:uncharacterized protein (TIGR02466 family)
MIVDSIFPTPIGFFKFRELNQKEINFITSLNQENNVGNYVSKEKTILKNENLSLIHEFILNSVKEYVNEIYKPKNNVTPYITQSWANWTNKEEFHHKHAHPNSFVSGVFYLKANKEFDSINFHRDGYEAIKLYPTDFNLWNSESWQFPIETGDLIIFPSKLTHTVEKIKHDDGLRISLAFNTFLTGYVGNDENLTGLHL